MILFDDNFITIESPFLHQIFSIFSLSSWTCTALAEIFCFHHAIHISSCKFSAFLPLFVRNFLLSTDAESSAVPCKILYNGNSENGQHDKFYFYVSIIR